MRSHVCTTSKTLALAAGLLLAALSVTCIAEPVVIEMDLPAPGAVEQASGYIVEASSVDAAVRAVKAVGGEVTVELAESNAVGARLLPAQVELLKHRNGVRSVIEDKRIEAPDTGLASRATTALGIL